MDFTRKLLLVLFIALVAITVCEAEKNRRNGNNGRGRGQAKAKSKNSRSQSQESSESPEDDDVVIAELELPEEVPSPQDMRACFGKWTNWGQWGECDKIGLHQRRERMCKMKRRCRGRRLLCPRGQAHESRRCGNDPCDAGPRQGEWSEWGCWSQDCLSGYRYRYRQCNNPLPAGADMDCYGRNQETEYCNGGPTTTTEEPTTPKPCLAGQDVIFALDASGSIGDENFKQMTSGIISLISSLDNDKGNNFPSQVRTGIIVFSDAATKFHDLDDLSIPLAPTYLQGGTNTHYAIDLANDVMFTVAEGDRPMSPNVLVILTDGESTDPPSTLAAATAAKAAGIKIIAVGIGNNYDENELKQMVSNENTDVYTVKEFVKLTATLQSLFSC